MRQIKTGQAPGSGATKGWAYIGVVDTLSGAGIRIDVIGALAGTTRRSPLLEKWIRSFGYWDVIRLMDFSWQRGGLLRGKRVFNPVRVLMPDESIEQCHIRFGARVDPVPLSLIRTPGAERVLAVDLSHDAHLMQQDLFAAPIQTQPPQRPTTWRARWRQRLAQHLTQRRLDISSQPYCSRIGTLDFHRAEEAIAAGRAAVEKKMDELLPLVQSR